MLHPTRWLASAQNAAKQAPPGQKTWEKNMSDILIKNLTVVDGTGAHAFAADVRQRGGLIAEVGPNRSPAGAPIFDATGCQVTPASKPLRRSLAKAALARVVTGKTVKGR